jgi:lactoylglutathione lyase
MDSERPPRRPFAVLGVQQIAIGCAERAPLHRLWTEIFGLEPTQMGITIASENVVEDILVVGRGETAVEIDLMTPIDPEKSPKVKRYSLDCVMDCARARPHSSRLYVLLLCV